MKKAAKPKLLKGDFSTVAGRNSVDVFLRSAEQHHVQVSVMADVKANIIITASSIVLTLAFNRFNEPGYRHSLMILIPFITLALLFAIVAVLPKHRSLHWPEGTPKPSMFNLLFFGHFASLPKQRFLTEMERVMQDDAQLYRTSVEDIYGIGVYLNGYKYRFLRWSYAFFLAGFLLAALLAAGELLL